MTREETQKILMSVQALFPNYNPPNKTVVVNTWCDMLSDYTYEQVSMALKMYAVTETKGYPPSIGQIIDKIHLTTDTDQLNEMQAWTLVSKAITNGYYHSEEEFAKLPPIVQKAVGSPSQLRQWAITDSSSVENVIQSNFIKTYRAVSEREKDVAKLPPGIQKLIEKNQSLRLENRFVQQLEEKRDYTDCIPMPDKAKKRLKEIL